MAQGRSTKINSIIKWTRTRRLSMKISSSTSLHRKMTQGQFSKDDAVAKADMRLDMSGKLDISSKS